MAFNVGALRKRITLQSRATTQDTFGGQSTTWTDVATVWAEIEPAGGRELMAVQSLPVAITHSIAVRYRAELANPKTVAGMRAVYGTRIFDIHASMNESERNRMVTLL